MNNPWFRAACAKDPTKIHYWEMLGNGKLTPENYEALETCNGCPILGMCRATAYRLRPESMIMGGIVWSTHGTVRIKGIKYA